MNFRNYNAFLYANFCAKVELSDKKRYNILNLGCDYDTSFFAKVYIMLGDFTNGKRDYKWGKNR